MQIDGLIVNTTLLYLHCSKCITKHTNTTATALFPSLLVGFHASPAYPYKSFQITIFLSMKRGVVVSKIIHLLSYHEINCPSVKEDLNVILGCLKTFSLTNVLRIPKLSLSFVQLTHQTFLSTGIIEKHRVLTTVSLKRISTTGHQDSLMLHSNKCRDMNTLRGRAH